MPSQMDAAYSRPGFYWGRQPNWLCDQVCEFVPTIEAHGKRAIDLGCGEGRDAVRFARHGFQVTALDVSRPGLDKAVRWATEEGLHIDSEQGSILDWRLDGDVYLVYASGTLHYLPPRLRAPAFDHYKAQTVPGGVHAFNAFVEKPFIETPPDYAPDEYFYRSGELLAYYWDWEVLLLREDIFPCNSGGIAHRHAMDTLICRKVLP